MSKAGKRRNRERDARRAGRDSHTEARNLPEWQLATDPMHEADIEWALDNAHNVFALDPDDTPVPFFEAFPGGLGMVMLNCLRGSPTTAFDFDDNANPRPTVFTKFTAPDGTVWIRSSTFDGEIPLTVARDIPPAMAAKLKERIEAAARV